jgi:hypothetical protein
VEDSKLYAWISIYCDNVLFDVLLFAMNDFYDNVYFTIEYQRTAWYGQVHQGGDAECGGQ